VSAASRCGAAGKPLLDAEKLVVVESGPILLVVRDRHIIIRQSTFADLVFDIQCQQRVILCSRGHRCARTVAKVAYTSIAARNPLALRPPCSLIGLPNSTFRVSVVQLLGQDRPPDTRLPTEMTA